MERPSLNELSLCDASNVSEKEQGYDMSSLFGMRNPSTSGKLWLDRDSHNPGVTILSYFWHWFHPHDPPHGSDI